MKPPVPPLMPDNQAHPRGSSTPQGSARQEETRSASFVRLFKPQFAAMVESGTKLQTVRPTPKRLPRAGDRISLRAWTGKPYRSKQRVLRESTITKVGKIKITEQAVVIEGYILHHQDEEELAMADGFSSIVEMTEWFREEHGLPFRGVLIKWQPIAP